MSLKDMMGSLGRAQPPVTIPSPSISTGPMAALGDLAQKILGGMGGAMQGGKENPASNSPTEDTPSNSPPSPEQPRINSGMTGMRNAIIRPGQASGRWQNPYISVAIPALLQLYRSKELSSEERAQLRPQLSLEVRLFREKLATLGGSQAWLDEASYLLCTYIDEVLSNEPRQSTAGIPEKSLLVEFHNDAWGGEDCFKNLKNNLEQEHRPTELLEFYDFILNLGLQGRYRMLERGQILLHDLRTQLHTEIWRKAPAQLAILADKPVSPRWHRWTPFRLLMLGLGLLLFLWMIGAWELTKQGEPVRQAMAAYEPPVREINLAETLPPPLPTLLAEGWLIAEKHPEGWRLIFKSDGAFGSGQGELNPAFKTNIERLGKAFSPWPGDLEVLGHTDMRPIRASRFASNQALSEARSRAVAELLRTATLSGVMREIVATGMGDSHPIIAEDTPQANEKNRRVEVIWKVANLGKKTVHERLQ